MTGSIERVVGVAAGEPAASADVLVNVEGVSKRFCRSLKRSLWYGMQDVVGELLPGSKRRLEAGP
ncbi:MAG: hypothetical protein ACKN9U_01355, partial [Pirellulaceae bacterium]